MAYATSYEQTTTVTQTYSESRQTTDAGVIDKAYIKGIPGLLKLIEVVLVLLAFLLVVTASYSCYLPGANGWFCFVTMLCFVTTVVLYFLLLFKLQFRCFRCHCIFWPLVEMGYYIGAVVLLLIADVVLSAAACSDLLKAGVAFGWFSLGAYGVDLGFSVYRYRKSRLSSHKETTTTTTVTDRY